MEQVVCIDTEYDKCFGDFSQAQLHELYQLTMIIDKRARRKITASNYQRILEGADPRLVSLAWLMNYSSDEDVIRFIKGVMI